MKLAVPISKGIRLLSRSHTEDDERQDLPAGKTANGLAGPRIDDVRRDLAVGIEPEFTAGEVTEHEAVLQGVPP